MAVGLGVAVAVGTWVAVGLGVAVVVGTWVVVGLGVAVGSGVTVCSPAYTISTPGAATIVTPEVLLIIFFKEAASVNESSYTNTTVSGIVITSIELQPLNAPLSISATGLPDIVEGITISVSLPRYPHMDT